LIGYFDLICWENSKGIFDSRKPSAHWQKVSAFQKSLAEFAARRRQRNEIIFSRDMRVRENTSQAASVEFVRLRRTNYARSRLQAFCRKNPEGFSTVTNPPPIGRGFVFSPLHYVFRWGIMYALKYAHREPAAGPPTPYLKSGGREPVGRAHCAGGKPALLFAPHRLLHLMRLAPARCRTHLRKDPLS